MSIKGENPYQSSDDTIGESREEVNKEEAPNVMASNFSGFQYNFFGFWILIARSEVYYDVHQANDIWNNRNLQSFGLDSTLRQLPMNEITKLINGVGSRRPSPYKKAESKGM